MILKTLKEELFELRKETEAGIERLAHRYASAMLEAAFEVSDLSQDEHDLLIAGLLAHGTILNKTKIAIEEEIESIEKAIKILTEKEEGKE